jgi:hypothetical protein
MDSLHLLKKIERTSRLNKIDFLKGFNILSKNIKIAEDNEFIDLKSQITRDNSYMYISSYMKGNNLDFKDGFTEIINSDEFDVDTYGYLLNAAMSVNAPPDMISNLLDSLFKNPKTEKAMIKNYNMLLDLALVTKNPNFTQIMDEMYKTYYPNSPELSGALKKWEGSNPKLKKEEPVENLKEEPAAKQEDISQPEKEIQQPVEQSSIETPIQNTPITEPDVEPQVEETEQIPTQQTVKEQPLVEQPIQIEEPITENPIQENMVSEMAAELLSLDKVPDLIEKWKSGDDRTKRTSFVVIRKSFEKFIVPKYINNPLSKNITFNEVFDKAISSLYVESPLESVTQSKKQQTMLDTIKSMKSFGSEITQETEGRIVLNPLKKEAVVGGFLSIPLEQSGDSFVPAIDMSILYRMLEGFSEIESKSSTSQETHERLIGLFSSDYRELLEKAKKTKYDAKGGDETDAARKSRKEYGFYTEFRKNILDNFYRSSLYNKLPQKAIQIILEKFSKSGQDSSIESVFDSKTLQSIIDQTGINMLPEDLLALIEEKFSGDMLGYYQDAVEKDRQFSLQAQLSIFTESNEPIPVLANFCMTCGRFRRGGDVCSKEKISKYAQQFWKQNKNQLQWRGAIADEETTKQPGFKMFRGKISPSDFDSTTRQISDYQRSFLTDEAAEMLGHGCSVKFNDATGEFVTECQIVENQFYEQPQDHRKIENRMEISNHLEIAGVPLTVPYDIDPDTGEQKKEPVMAGNLYTRFFDGIISDLLDKNVNGNENDNLVNEEGRPVLVDGQPVSIAKALEVFVTRHAKHGYTSFTSTQLNLTDISPGNGEKVIHNMETGEDAVVTKTDGEVVTELSKPIFNMFLNIEKNKINKEMMEIGLQDYLQRSDIKNRITQGEDPNLIQKEWEEGYLYRRAMAKYYKFLTPSLPNISFFSQFFDKGKEEEAIKKYGGLVEDKWIEFAGYLNLTEDGGPVFDHLLAHPSLFSRDNAKEIHKSINAEIIELMTKAYTIYGTPEEAQPVIDTMLRDMISSVGLPEQPREKLSTKIDKIEKLEKNEEKRKAMIAQAHKEHMSEIEENSKKPNLDMWEFIALNMKPEALRSFSKNLINQMYSGIPLYGQHPINDVTSSVQIIREIMIEGNSLGKGEIRQKPTEMSPERFKALYGDLSESEARLIMRDQEVRAGLPDAPLFFLESVRDQIRIKQDRVDQIEAEVSTFSQNEEEKQNKLVELWRSFLANEIYPEVSKTYTNVDIDLFFDVLGSSLSQLVDKMGKSRNTKTKQARDKYEVASGFTAIPMDVIKLSEMENNFGNDESFGGIPVSSWFLSQYSEARKSLSHVAAVNKVVDERRKYQKIRWVSDLDDDETAKAYVIAGIQKDLKKTFLPSFSGQITGESFTNALKNMPEDIKEDLIGLFVSDDSANQEILNSIDSALRPIMPKRTKDSVFHHYTPEKIPEGKEEEVRIAHEKVYPNDLEDFVKYCLFDESIAEPFNATKEAAKGSYHTERMRQILSYLSLQRLSRMKVSQGGQKEKVQDYIPGSDGVTESALYTLYSNSVNGSLPNANKGFSELGYAKQEEGRSVNRPYFYHSLINLSDGIQKHFGMKNAFSQFNLISGTHPEGVDKIRKKTKEEQKRGSSDWYKLTPPIPIINKRSNKIKKELERFYWYKESKTKNIESVYESVLVLSDADALNACRNIANRTSRKIRNSATISIFVPFEEFGSLANVYDFNKQSSLKAMALTRKECDFLRKVKMM